MNYATPPKKMIILNILDILRKYSDENHRLSAKDIGDRLEREYSQKVDRKAIKRNLMNLIDFGYEIEFSESIRTNKSGEEEIITSDWYLVRDFTDSELRLLIDGLLFSKHIPYSQCKELVEKIEGLSNKYFCSRIKYIKTLPDNEYNNKQIFYTIEILDEAISKGKQVSFYYSEYDTNKSSHYRKKDDGENRLYVINPYQMAAVNGRYYLICNYDKYDNLANYRIDRIENIKILDNSAKPLKQVNGSKNGLNLPKHMAEHIYMFSGDSGTVKFRAKKYILNDIFDWFGNDVQFSDETEEDITVSVYVNLNAMRRWAMQYALHAKVLSPESFVSVVKDDVLKAAENYLN